MNSKAIETLAVSAVRDSIDVCNYLQQYIDLNDKSPSWDGFVYIYEDPDKSKKHLVGRVPVQVKGKESCDFSHDTISYSADISDLRNYLNGGGSIYFVVLIHPSTQARKIYYAELTPIKLHVLLDNLKKTRKTKTIQLKAFPDDNYLKTNIFLSCRSDCDKQASFINANLLSLEDLEKSGWLKSLTFSVYSIGFRDIKEAIVNSEIYMYANVNGFPIPQPIEAIPELISVTEDIKETVSVDGLLFYDHYRVLSSKNNRTLYIGNSLQLTFANKAKAIKVKFKNPDSIRQSAIDLEFFLKVLEKGHFEIGKTIVQFDVKEYDEVQLEVSRVRERISLFKQICSVLDLLGCSDDIAPSTLKENDWKNAVILIRTLIDKQPIRNLRDDLAFIQIVTFGEKRFLLVFDKQQNEPNTYIVSDFFSTEYNIACKDQNGDYQRISQYAMLKANDYLCLANVRYDTILPSFLKYRNNSLNMVRLNGTLLELILAYDKRPTQMLLNVIEEMSQWLLDNLEERELPYNVRLINRLQVIKRQRALNQSEMEKLNAVVMQANACNDILAGAYLLMGNPILADVYLNKMEEGARNEFVNYPIYHFHENNN